MNLRQANDRIINLEKRGNQLRPGMLSVEKSLFDRLVAQNQELKRAKQRMEIDLRQSKDMNSQLKMESNRKSQVSFNDGNLQRQV